MSHTVSLTLLGTLLLAFVLSSLSTQDNTSALAGHPHGSQGPAGMCGVSKSPVQSEHAYHKEPPTGPLPATLDPSQFADDQVAFVAYSIAAKIPGLLYREPCYCECDRFAGHRSLLDCYTSRHGQGCEKCQAEVLFIYEQSRLGRNADEIRAAMDKGDYRNIDTQKYASAHDAEYRRSAP